MATRRERTTALPRLRPRQEKAIAERRFLGRTWSEREVRGVVLGGLTLVLLVIVGALAWNWYADAVLRPRSAVITVGDEKFSLSYYADRLGDFTAENQDVGSQLLIEQALLSKLEEEGLTMAVARDRGIALSEADVTQAIATRLGVPVGGTGSPFDARYRAELKTTGMSDTNYRRLVRAELADTRLREQLRAEVGETGELVTLRGAALATREEAEAVLKRVQGGENLGTVAQTVSIDTTSKVNDGLLTAAPPPLLPDALKAAIEGRAAGTLIENVVEVEGRFWVLKVETRDPAGAYNESHKEQLIDLRFQELIDAKRAELLAAGKLKRSFDPDDARWAREHADFSQLLASAGQ